MTNSYSQTLGGSIFKNKGELNLEKFINLDITKYKPNDIKKIIGQDFQKDSWIDTDKFNITRYTISVSHKGNDYRLILSEKNNNLILGLELYNNTTKKYYFKNCEEIKNKYEKNFGKNFRYTNVPANEKNPRYYQSLKFQLNYPNHIIDLTCFNYGENYQTTWIFNKNKKEYEFMDELIFISCVIDRKKLETKYLPGYEMADDYKVKRMDVPDKFDLFIDNYFKIIGRRSNISENQNREIKGEYKIFNKDRIEVVENTSDEPDLINVTWQLNRVNGDIELLLESKNHPKILHSGGIRKDRYYGNCQKSKGNVF